MNTAVLRLTVDTCFDVNYNEHEKNELERYGVKFDFHGKLVERTVEDAFGGLHQKLYEHFGEEYRTLLHAEYAQEGTTCPFFRDI
jgi:hypothetical protein